MAFVKTHATIPIFTDVKLSVPINTTYKVAVDCNGMDRISGYAKFATTAPSVMRVELSSNGLDWDIVYNIVVDPTTARLYRWDISLKEAKFVRLTYTTAGAGGTQNVWCQAQLHKDA